MTIYVVNCTPWLSDESIEQALPHLDDKRRSRIRHLRVPLKRAQCAAAGLLLSHLFGENGNAPALVYNENGKPYLYDAFGYQESTGRVDLNLEGIGQTPDTIEELRVPTYFESGNWDYTPYVHYPYPDANLTSYLGTWQRWTEKDGKRVVQYIIYQQMAIFPAAGEFPAGYGQFYISLGNDAPVEQTTLNIDGQEFQVYLVGESELDELVGFNAHTDVIWSDGEYAYQITTGEMDLDMIEDIIRSIAPTDDLGAFIRPAVFDPIETHYTLSNVPEEMTLRNTEDNGHYVWKSWRNGSQSIELWQQRIQSEDRCGQSGSGLHPLRSLRR